MSQKAEVTVPCEYNALVECPLRGRNCAVCGWNPAIEKYRRFEARMKLAEREEKK